MGGNFENNDYLSLMMIISEATWKSVANLFTFGNGITSEKNLANQYGYHFEKRAIFGSVQIGYKSLWLYLDVTARNDWSSTFKGRIPVLSSIRLSVFRIITDIFRCSTDIMPHESTYFIRK